MEVFGEIERVAADLYPYRWPISIGLAIVAAAALWFAFMRGWHLVVLRYKLISGVTAVVLVVVVGFAGNYFLSPLWERSELHEPSPLAFAAEPTGEAPITDDAPPAATQELPDEPADEPAFEPGVVAQGEFSGADDFHFGRGDALLIETEPGVYTLRVEEFSVRNGPDLFVYLTPDKDSVDGAINLGDLKATDGNFNYDVPAGTDVSQFQYAVVWCRQFAVLFSSAPLEPA